MSSAPHVERFKGIKWEECHDFIAAIRARALWEGKQRDSAWKADFAAPLFWGKALSWHSQLPEDVREDWAKLEVALIKQWPPTEDDDEPQIQPTPAAAPSLNPSDKASPPLQGILKVVVDGSNTSYYVKLHQGSGRLSNDMSEALRIRCNSLSRATLLELIGHSCDSWLALHWASATAHTGPGSTEFAYITCIDLGSLKSSWDYTGPFQLLTYTVLSSGEVIPVWKKDNTSQITLTPFVSEAKVLYLAADAKSYAGAYPMEKRAKLFIEPTN